MVDNSNLDMVSRDLDDILRKVNLRGAEEGDIIELISCLQEVIVEIKSIRLELCSA